MTNRAPSGRLVHAGLDAVLALLALPVALWLAGPGNWPSDAGWWALALPVSLLCVLPFGWAFRLHAQYWRFSGVHDLMAVAATALGGALLLRLVMLWPDLPPPANPTFPVLHAMVLGLMLGLPRLAGRLQAFRRLVEPEAAPSILVAGSADEVDLFLHALARQRRPAYRVEGVLTRRTRQAGRRLHGAPILGSLDDGPAVLDALRAARRLPAMLVLTSPRLRHGAMNRLLDAADRHGVATRAAPSPTALRDAAPRPGAESGPGALVLRPISIEELLDRPQVSLDREGMARLVQGRRVLVTGAGGTIGGELARQVAALGPAMLTLLDHGEYALYQIDLELSEHHPAIPRRAMLADVRDEVRLRRLMQEARPELVFHAAALKHVPMVESDPLEGVLTNTHGTRVVADAAQAAGAALMVFISTDKAVNPTSVMGASKRLAEMYCQALDRRARAEGQGMRCITVRFGNVLGSTGSVVPLFTRQLQRGGPLTVTHPDMRRYFMTVREAVGLVLQAAVVGAADRADAPPELRDGGIFVLDMGEPVKIVDLARRMIRLAGLRPEQDVEIRFTGLRPGEKLFEETFHGQEPPRDTAFPGLLVATPRTADPALVGRALEEMAATARTGHAGLVLAQLSRLVPEFSRNGTGGASHADTKSERPGG